jgi:hypothetical protein
MTYKTQTDVDDTGKEGAETGMAPAERIRDLNDELRTTGFGGKIYLTRGMWAKGSDFVAYAVSAVRAFDKFTDDNDPWQEHERHFHRPITQNPYRNRAPLRGFQLVEARRFEANRNRIKS